MLVGAYVAGWTNLDNPQQFARLSHDERLRISRESVEALHPGRSHLLTKGVSVGWGLMPYSEGVGALWPRLRRCAARTCARPGYARAAQARRPDRLRRRASELSVGLWQEGAALSAHEALKLVAAMAQARKPPKPPTPGRCAATVAQSAVDPEDRERDRDRDRAHREAELRRRMDFAQRLAVLDEQRDEQRQAEQEDDREAGSIGGAIGRRPIDGPITMRIAALSIEPLVPLRVAALRPAFQTGPRTG